MKIAEARPDTDKRRAFEILETKLVIQKIAQNFIDTPFCNGPFVIDHNDLNPQNIFLDDDHSITGIIDFPGTIGPIASVCRMPGLFDCDTIHPITSDLLWKRLFKYRELNTPSYLNDRNTRYEVLNAVIRTHDYDHCFSFLRYIDLAYACESAMKTRLNWSSELEYYAAMPKDEDVDAESDEENGPFVEVSWIRGYITSLKKTVHI